MQKTKSSLTVVLAAVGVLVLAVPAPTEAKKAKRRPVKLEEQLDFGVDMAKRGLWNEALFRFRRAAELSPGNSRVLNNLAVAHEAVGQFDRAMELYKQALGLDPGNNDLKKNYARFVEFYQGFNPPKPQEADAAETKTDEAPADGGAGSDSSGPPVASIDPDF